MIPFVMNDLVDFDDGHLVGIEPLRLFFGDLGFWLAGVSLFLQVWPIFFERGVVCLVEACLISLIFEVGLRPQGKAVILRAGQFGEEPILELVTHS